MNTAYKRKKAVTPDKDKQRKSMIAWFDKIIAEIPEFEGAGYTVSDTEIVFFVPIEFVNDHGAEFNGFAVCLGDKAAVHRMRYIEGAVTAAAKSCSDMVKYIEAMPEIIQDVQQHCLCGLRVGV